jgi:anti-sigma B factor antagonist
VSSLELRTTPVCSSPQVVTLVTITGAIDLANASQLRNRLDAVPDRGTVVDLAGVTLLAATGLTVLLDLHHRLHKAGAPLVLLGVPPHVRRMLDTTALDAVLAVTPVITEAAELATAPPSPTTSTTGDDTTSVAAIPPCGTSPRASPRHLRALPASELIDPRQTHHHNQPYPGGIA